MLGDFFSGYVLTSVFGGRISDRCLTYSSQNVTAANAIHTCRCAGVDISVTVCLFVCVFVRLRISPARIKLAASHFARWFGGVLGRESPSLGNFAPPEVPNRTNRRAAGHARARLRHVWIAVPVLILFTLLSLCGAVVWLCPTKSITIHYARPLRVHRSVKT